MEFEWDEPKRRITLSERGLDFAKAKELFAGSVFTVEDDRFDYGEERYISIGKIGRKTVLVVWTPRQRETRRIISMRLCDAKEREAYQASLGRPG